MFWLKLDPSPAPYARNLEQRFRFAYTGVHYTMLIFISYELRVKGKAFCR